MNKERRMSRRRTLSSPGNVFEPESGAVKKPRLFGRSKSCGSDLLLASFAGLPKAPTFQDHKRTRSLDDFVTSGYLSPRNGNGSDSLFKKSPPPSEKLRRLIENFNIDSPSNGREEDPRRGGRHEPRKLTMLSQLPKTSKHDDEIMMGEDDENIPPDSVRPNVRSGTNDIRRTSSFLSFADCETSPIHLHRKFHDAPEQILPENSNTNKKDSDAKLTVVTSPIVPTTSETTKNDPVVAEEPPSTISFDMIADASEPTIPDWFGKSEEDDSVSAPSGSESSIKRHFPVAKSPFRPGSGAEKQVTSFFSPCSFGSTPSSRTACHSTPMTTMNASFDSDSRPQRPDDGACDVTKELTPSTAKLKIMPQRPSKGGKKLRRQRSLRMHGAPSRNENATTTTVCPTRDLHSFNRQRRKTVTGVPRSVEGRDMDRSASSMNDLVLYMKRAHVRMIAIDWDQTFLRCHTRSQWYGTAAELKEHLRPKVRSTTQTCARRPLDRVFLTLSLSLSYTFSIARARVHTHTHSSACSSEQRIDTVCILAS